MPNKEVQERLKISYEDLEEPTREVFLDIACFFVDNKYVSSDEVAAMWAACEFYPELAIEELISMCLVKKDERGIYRMHDHIKDLGRDIVRQEGPKDLEQRSRIWKKQDSTEILTSRKKENSKIEGIILMDLLNAYQKHNEIWTLRAENFVNLDKLRFLCVDGQIFVAPGNPYFEMQVEGSIEHLLPNLRWLYLKHMKIMRFNVTNFNLKKLVILNLSNTNITESWVGWKEFKVPNSFGAGLVNLERLSLSWCMSLESLPNSVTSLPKLRHLDLSGCWKLKKLPDSIGELAELEVLLLEHCEGLVSLPNSLTSLPKLHFLNLKGCKSLESLPDSVGETMVLQLTELDISYCEWLKKLPGFISKQKKLEVLLAVETRMLGGDLIEIEELTCLREIDFNQSNICGLPSLVKLTRLEKLSLMYCYNLQQLPAELPTSLVELHVRSESLQSIPDYSYLIHLTELTFVLDKLRGDLVELQELNLSWIWRLSKLKNLKLRIWKNFTTTIESEESSSVSLLPQLEELTLRCSVLGTCFVMPSFLSALTRLKISLYRGTTSLSLPRLNRLTHFTLSKNYALAHILGLGELESLIFLKISNCHSLDRLDDISKLTKLQTVDIWVCKKLRVIPVVPSLRSLKELEISGCRSLESLVGPSESESCLYDVFRVNKSWNISYCPLLKNKLPDDLKRRMEEEEQEEGDEEEVLMVREWVSKEEEEEGDEEEVLMVRRRIKVHRYRDMARSGLIEFTSANQGCTAQKTATESQPPLSFHLGPAPTASVGSGRGKKRKLKVMMGSGDHFNGAGSVQSSSSFGFVSPTPTWSYPQQTRDFPASQVNFAQGQSLNLHDMDRCIDQITAGLANLSISEPPSTDQLFIGSSSGFPVISSASSSISTPTHTFQFKSMEKELRTIQSESQTEEDEE